MTLNYLKLQVAQSPCDVEAIQALRFDVFFNEFDAVSHTPSHEKGLDCDVFDEYCDHLMVIDTRNGNRVVAATRLLFAQRLPKDARFISEAEFDIPLLDKYGPKSLEIGRSCVDSDYRDGKAIQLLWQGITKYIFDFDVKFLFGCASFHETDPKKISHELAYLYHNHLADETLRARSLDHIPMDLMSMEDINRSTALSQLPPLIKGYLQLGGVVGDGLAYDKQFKTLDVLIMVETSKVPDRYVKYFKKRAERITLNHQLYGVAKC